MRLKNKVALITGAGSGIGQASAVLFAKEGAKVVVVDIDPKRGLETVNLIKNEGGEAMFVNADVTKASDAEKMVKTTVEKYGKLDILFNNVGSFLLLGTVPDTTEEKWDRIIEINLKSVFLGSKYAIPEMIKRGGGVIINTASENGLVGTTGAAGYCAAKGGVVLLTKAMALDHVQQNIRVNCICPCNVATPMLERFLATFDEQTRRKILLAMPMGRFGKPEEVAYAALFLASDESSYVTGSALVVDSGFTAQ